MKDMKEELKYGFKLYPFAILILLGLFLSSTGPVLLQGVISGMRNSAMYTPLRLLNVLAFQLLGGIVAVSGFFGALHKVLSDSSE